MKKILLLNIALVFTLLVNAQTVLNHFTSSKDTIVVVTNKIKGVGIFHAGASEIQFQDTLERYDYPVVFPKNITNIKLAYRAIDLKPWAFVNLKSRKSDTLTNFLKNNFPRKIDTLKIPSIRDNSLSIMSGQRGKDTIFIVDENNNKDFRDDSLRLYQKMDWKSTDKLIKCKYNIYNGKVMVEDFNWANIGTLGSNELLFFVSHHLESAFSIDNQRYKIGLIDWQSSFTFDEPILALISQNGIKKDTLLETELLKKGEYMKLNNSYYRFDDISNDGKYITLIKENDFNSKIGTQVGMIAPDFNGHSIDGDSVSFADYKSKYLLLVNVSACWSKISSYKCYKELTEAVSGKIEILGIDNSPNFLKQNIKDLNLSGKFIIAEDKNSSIQKNYRPGFCSRTCFLINPEGRIIDKFEVFDWKTNLASYLNFKNETR